MHRIGMSFLATLLASCVSDPEDLTEPVDWDPPPVYSYTYERSCFCPESVRGPFLVRAGDHTVTAVYRTTANADTIPVTERIQSYSIDSIWTELNASLEQEPASASVVYDNTYGFPVHAELDFNAQTADDEYSFDITDFRDLAD